MTLVSSPSPPPEFTSELRRFVRDQRAQGAAWWHGNPTQEDVFHDPTPGLEGLWLADRVQAALWYTTHPETGTGELLAVQASGPFPALRDPAVLRRLCEQAGLDPREVRRDHERGTLYLTHQAAICQAAQREYPGLLLRDDTRGPHGSLVVWDDRRVRVTGRYAFTPARVTTTFSSPMLGTLAAGNCGSAGSAPVTRLQGTRPR